MPRAPVQVHWMAIVSLIMGIIAICSGLTAPLAILWGHWGRSKIRNDEARFTGAGLALSGLILGYLTLGAWGALFYKVSQESLARKNFTLQPYAAAKKLIKTKIEQKEKEDVVPAPPPAGKLELVLYPTELGPMAAYVSPNLQDGLKRPGVVWVTGGFSNSIDAVWEPAPAENDQTASAFREADCVMMYPSFRGGNRNPGVKEGFFGEVEDLVFAIHWLKQRPYVDPNRIYVGGHSTGGTMVLLAAAADSAAVRAVFSFGPVHDPAIYGDEYVLHTAKDDRERQIRAPMYWMKDITAPTLIIEGTEDGNAECFGDLKSLAGQAPVSFVPMPGMDHFSVIQPVSKVLAEWIKSDTGATPVLPTAAQLQSVATKAAQQ
jgi:acetyl esterase/lipase